MTEQELFDEMKSTLFPNIKEYDFIHHFCNQFLSSHLREAGTYDGTDVRQGNEVQGFSICLQPHPGNISRDGHELCCALAKIHNEQYWLIKLWLRMYEDARELDISREIVRGFIKHCINVTTLELADLREAIIDKTTIKPSNVSDKLKYFQKIFKVGDIMRNIRDTQKQELVRRHKNARGVKIKALKNNSIEELKKLFKNNNLSAYLPLIDLCCNADTTQKIQTSFIKVLLLQVKNSKGKGELNRKMMQILRGEI